ncbi:uncharacterized protein BXZ73DRAFT_104319 [Epithele typhae]|uniref:uncharacterized protein n=1 Tax=Epithele typhae TaxID=378194 RepID=UPI00200804A9|nr:uncharacterized protein BXZ73DRAFT_104319 [Epithele typhae]KAH9921698.1 hypothetical protein BXZ73DRAFT_104319 [Epithele typhae]
MGSAQSLIPVATLILAGTAVYGFTHLNKPTGAAQEPTAPAGPSSSSSKKSKSKKKAAPVDAGSSAQTQPSEKAAAAPEPGVVSFPPVLPGSFDVAPPAQSERAKPKKKKKAKKAGSAPAADDAQSESSATAPETSAAATGRGKPKRAAASVDEDGWTKVEARVQRTQKGAPGVPQLDVNTSDAGVTTSVTGTGNSSPVTERTEEEGGEPVTENRRTLAEKLLPKPWKTGVEDLLEEPDYPQISRVMRIKPRPDEQPATGFSWADYEDVDSRGTANDADGEDDGGWGVVKSRGRTKVTRAPSQQTPTAQTASESVTKKQRQRAAKKDAEKSAKADAEAQRLATLAKHKRELEQARMAEQSKSSRNTASGGMSASVDENGKLIWQ